MHFNTKTVRQIFLIFVIGIAIGNISTMLFNVDNFFNWQDFLLRSFYSVILTLFFYKGNEAIIKYLNKKNSWVKNTRMIVIKHIVATVTYSLSVIFIFYLYIWYFLMHQKNLHGFIVNFRIGFYLCFSITAIWTLINYANYFFKYWKNALIREEQLKRESLALQYESLKNQVNPHFLFNCLNILTSLIERDKESSIKFVKQLSDVFRYVLDQNVRELVDADTELKFVESYLYLQRIRFGENIHISIEIADHNFKIVPMALQLLIENAIKHNTISHENPLTISIFDHAEFISVVNNFQKKTIIPDSSGIGLKTLSFQYEFISGKNIEIIPGNDFFTVNLPKVKAK